MILKSHIHKKSYLPISNYLKKLSSGKKRKHFRSSLIRNNGYTVHNKRKNQGVSREVAQLDFLTSTSKRYKINHLVNLPENTLHCSYTRKSSTQPHNQHWRKKFRGVGTNHQFERYHQESLGKITTSHLYPFPKRRNSRLRQK